MWQERDNWPVEHEPLGADEIEATIRGGWRRDKAPHREIPIDISDIVLPPQPGSKHPSLAFACDTPTSNPRLLPGTPTS